MGADSAGHRGYVEAVDAVEPRHAVADHEVVQVVEHRGERRIRGQCHFTPDDVGPVDVAARGQGVVGAHDEYVVEYGDRLLRQLGAVWRRVEQREVQRAVREPARQLGRINELNFDFRRCKVAQRSHCAVEHGWRRKMKCGNRNSTRATPERSRVVAQRVNITQYFGGSLAKR